MRERMNIGSYDILIIGHVSRDINVYRGQEERVTGGAVFYASFSAKRSGSSVLAVTKLSQADADLADPLKAESVEVMVLDTLETTSIRNIYKSEDRERREVTLLARASSFQLNQIPRSDVRIIYLAGLFAGEIPLDLIPPLSETAEIALDVQGVLRCSEGGNLVFRDWKNKERYLPRITYLKTDAAEALILTGEHDREKASRILQELGAREVMVTHNTEVLVCCDQKLYRAPFNPKNLSGRTGRGDTCFAAYLSWRTHHNIQESVEYAAALTSLKMETPGPFRGSVQDVLSTLK